LRRGHAIFSRRYFLTGKPVAGESFKDITWFTPAGTEMTDSDWQQGYARCLSVHLSGAAVHRTDSHGRPVRDENFTLLFNAHHGTMAFVMPPLSPLRSWRVELQTATGRPGPAEHLAGGATRMVPARSIVLLMEVTAPWAVARNQR
jgi:glycogen operon protein